jgi:hypothetical protein
MQALSAGFTIRFWRGSASDTLSNKSEKNTKNLNKEAQKMFQHFPPGAPKE